MNSIWQDAKEYFGDGHVAGTSPLAHHVHCCELKPALTQNDNIYYGVEISEETMPLFSPFGEISAPPCSCEGMKELCKYIEGFIAVAPNTHIDDYSIRTGKDDKSVDEACQYAVRDAMQWWINWLGSLNRQHHWKQLYVAFATIPDDVVIPPQDLYNDSFRLCGNSFSDLLAGLRSENVDEDDVTFMGKCLCRQYTLQYLEHIDSGIRDQLLCKTTLMCQYRTLTANTQGVAVGILASRNSKSSGPADQAVELASLCDAISTDIGKEILGILQGEKTETLAGENRMQLKRELLWLYVRYLGELDKHPSAPLMRRYATSGLHFVPMMDRYRERFTNIRVPLSAPLRARLNSYVNNAD
ncbi:hypothetical protein CBS147355_6063 [Penicillium roqueforti]|nr:hypothetical protein CBS147355_6063 [Penicillium roqueforti]